MNEQQLGLLLITPALVAFIVFMHRRGAMTLPGAIVAALASIVIATALFLAQTSSCGLKNDRAWPILCGIDQARRTVTA